MFSNLNILSNTKYNYTIYIREGKRSTMLSTFGCHPGTTKIDHERPDTFYPHDYVVIIKVK